MIPNFIQVKSSDDIRDAIRWLIAPTPTPPAEALRIGNALQSIISRRWKTGYVPPQPVFLLSERATRAWIDSIRNAMQHDPSVNKWPSGAFLNYASAANQLLMLERELEFSETVVNRNIDVINQELYAASSAVGPSAYGDAEDKSNNDPGQAFLLAATHPEIRLAVTLFSRLKSASLEDKLRLVFAAVVISWDENQWDTNADISSSTARGFWALVDDAIIDGLKHFRARWTESDETAARAWIAENIRDAKYGADPIIAGIGILTLHHEMINEQWKWTGASWALLRPGSNAKSDMFATRYKELLKYNWLGYFMLAMSYHVNHSAAISTYEDHHMKTGLPMALLVEDDPSLVPQLISQVSPVQTFVDMTSLPPLTGPDIAHLNNRILKDNGINVKNVASIVRGDGPPADVRSGWEPARRLWRMHQGRMQWVTRPHVGMDLRARSPLPVFSPWDGKVLRSYYSTSYGNTLWIDFPEKGYSMVFAHLSKRFPAVGEKVRAGQIIAMTGATPKNLKTPPHLHIEVWKHVNGKAVWQQDVQPVESMPDEAWKKVLYFTT